MVGHLEVFASTSSRVLGPSRLSRSRLGRRGSAAALVCAPSRYAERGTDGGDPAVRREGWDNERMATLLCGSWKISRAACRTLREGRARTGQVRSGAAPPLRLEAGRVPVERRGGGRVLAWHSNERIYYVAPWLRVLSGVTMTIERLSRRVWAARKGLIDMPRLTTEQALVSRSSILWCALRTLRRARASARSGWTGLLAVRSHPPGSTQL
jgi:hypothetical protein